jgi:hypothetical protein
MKNRVLIEWLVIAMNFLLVNPFDIYAQKPIPSQIQTYKTPSETAMLQEKHLYVFNGSTSVGLTPDHFGFHRIVAPPYFAFPFKADLQMFAQEVKVNRFDWYPSECVFEGVKIKGVETTMQVVPIKSKRGVLIKLTLNNLNQEEIIVPLGWTFSGSPGKSLNWEFSAETRSLLTKPLKAPTSIKTDGNSLSLVKLETRLIASLFGTEVKADYNSIGGDIKLQSGETRTLSLLVLIDAKDKLRISDSKNYTSKEESLIDETRTYWTTLIDSVGGRLPKLTGGTPELQAFYKTGLMSFLSTRFEVPEFLFNPFYATSGVDGGAANCYLWDLSYNSFITAILDGAVMRNQILQFFKVNIDECFAFDPIYGKAQGPRYSYNYYSMARGMYNYLAITGDTSILDEIIDGKIALKCLYEACLGFENMEEEAGLIDYGDNHNLLELKKTQNYTHVTPSPNGERVLTYQYLTEIYKFMGQKTPHDLINRDEVLKEKFIQKLWNPEMLWLNTLDENGNPRIAYSIQIFDVIRTGMLTREQEHGILTHLKEGEFLSEWGVHSLAVTDPGYDPGDVDWGGPGAYTGDPAELVTDLCQAGYAERGVDLLERILWWGELPYLPQAMRANEKGYSEGERANLIAGAVSCQAVINGLFGVSFELNRIKIKPINHAMMKGLSLTGVSARGHTFDIEINESTFTVTETGNEITKPLGEEVIFNLN